MITMHRMVFNDLATEILNKFKTGKLDEQQALTSLNKGLEYVLSSEKAIKKDNEEDAIQDS
jgi:hypothetical protein